MSGLSPFTANCDAAFSSNGGTAFIHAEVEPHLAVDPGNASRMVGAWQQDRWSNGSARGVVSAYSLDGGVTWTRVPLPFSRCGGGTIANGGDYARATDPWVSFAPDGTVHAMGLSTTGGSFQPGSTNAMLASRSLDGGRTWSDPATLIRDGAGFFNDKNTITADPGRQGLVYAVWDRLVAGNGGGPAFFTRSTDNGVTWEPARPIFDPGPGRQTIGNVIAVTPSGVLVNLFTQIDGSGPGARSSLNVVRSFDRGITWEAPRRIAELLAVGARDPETGTVVRDGSILGQIAAAPNGALYVVWQDARFNGGAYDAIAISRSSDDGATWTAPTRASTAAGVAAFTPSVHVSPNGTVGVTYFDFRSNTASAATLPTDYWMVRSTDGGNTWIENRVSAPFDLNTAPNANGLFLGDYHGFKSRGDVFVPFFVRTSSGDLTNRTDVWSAPQVSATASAATSALRAQAEASPATRAAPPGFRVTPELRRSVGAQIQRSMSARIPGWGEVTMRIPSPGPTDEPEQRPGNRGPGLRLDR